MMQVEHTIPIPGHDDRRPISVPEFRATVWLIAGAAVTYGLIMLILVP